MYTRTGLGQVPDATPITASVKKSLVTALQTPWNSGVLSADPGFRVAVAEGWVPDSFDGAVLFFYWIERLADLVAQKYWGFLGIYLMRRVSKMAPATWDQWVVSLFQNYANQFPALTPTERDVWLTETKRIQKRWPGVVAPVPSSVPVSTAPVRLPGLASSPHPLSPPGPGAGYRFMGTAQENGVDASVPGVVATREWDVWFNPSTGDWKRVAWGTWAPWGVGAIQNPVPANWRDLAYFADVATAPSSLRGTILSVPAVWQGAMWQQTGEIQYAPAPAGAVMAPAPMPVTVAPRPPLQLTNGVVTTSAGVPLTPEEINQAFPGFAQQVAAARPPPAATTTVMTSAGPLQVTTDAAGDVVAVEKKAGLPVGLLVAAGAGLLFLFGRKRRRA